MTNMRDAYTESYKMWAEDEKVYGPVDTATMVEWIQDERVFPQTFVQPQSDLRWRPAADIETLRVKFAVADDHIAEFGNGAPSLVDTLRESLS